MPNLNFEFWPWWYAIRNKVDELTVLWHAQTSRFVSKWNVAGWVVLKEVWLSRFDLLRKDRDWHRGGLAVYIAQHLSFKQLDYINSEIMDTTDLEMICFELSQLKSKKLWVGSIYRPLNSDISSFNSMLEETLNNFKIMGTEIILMGGFNADFAKTTSQTKSLQQITKSLSLKQLIKSSTSLPCQEIPWDCLRIRMISALYASIRERRHYYFWLWNRGFFHFR